MHSWLGTILKVKETSRKSLRRLGSTTINGDQVILSTNVLKSLDTLIRARDPQTILRTVPIRTGNPLGMLKWQLMLSTLKTFKTHSRRN